MGHSTITMTVDVYGHLIPGGNKEAVDRLDDPEYKKKYSLFQANLKPRSNNLVTKTRVLESPAIEKLEKTIGKEKLARRRGVEPPTYGSGIHHSIH